MNETSGFIAFVKLVKIFFIDAGALLMLVFLTYLLFRGKRAWMFKGATSVLWVGLFICASSKFTPWIAQELLIENRRLLVEAQQTDCYQKSNVIVVLGGGILSDDVPGMATLNRVNGAVTLAKQQAARPLKIVFSGGIGRSDLKNSEALVMQKYFLALLGPVPADNPPLQSYVEEKSLNTFQNAIGIAEFLRSKSLSSEIILVTSALHMSRSAQTFTKQGFKVCPFAVDSPEITGERSLISFENVFTLVQVINEYVGIMGYKLRGWI